MAADYSISVDPSGFVQYRLSGFFDSEELARFARQRSQALGRLDCAPGDFVTLVDVTECSIQSQDVAACFDSMMAMRDTVRRRLAFVVGDSLARLQVRRLAAARPNIRVFTARDEAEAWLRGSERAAA